MFPQLAFWLVGLLRILAVFVPTPGLITLPGELAAFWLQHYLIAIVCPAVLHFSGRYSRAYYADLRAAHYVSAMQGWLSFMLYQRVFLTTLSLFTWANLNFTLCGASSRHYTADPFVKSYGHYYYIMAEFYLGFAGHFCGRFYLVLCRGVLRLCTTKKSKSD